MTPAMTAITDFPELQTLAFEVAEAGLGVLRINRPERMNSQTVRMFAEYGLAARALRDSQLRALILTGAGERAFCAGFDLDEVDVITRMGVREFLQFQETAAGGIQSLRHLPFPVIAAVHGGAAGGGLALALAADIRLVSPTAKFSAAFLRVGLSMGELGTSYNLSRLIGPGRAAEVGYSGRIVGAEEAVAIGLANRVVPADRLSHVAAGLPSEVADDVGDNIPRPRLPDLGRESAVERGDDVRFDLALLEEGDVGRHGSR